MDYIDYEYIYRTSSSDYATAKIASAAGSHALGAFGVASHAGTLPKRTQC